MCDIERFDQGGKAIKRLLGQTALPCDPFTLTTLHPDHRLYNTVMFLRPQVVIPDLCQPARTHELDAAARALSPPEYWLWQRLLGNIGADYLNSYLQHSSIRLNHLYAITTPRHMYYFRLNMVGTAHAPCYVLSLIVSSLQDVGRILALWQHAPAALRAHPPKLSWEEPPRPYTTHEDLCCQVEAYFGCDAVNPREYCLKCRAQNLPHATLRVIPILIDGCRVLRWFCPTCATLHEHDGIPRDPLPTLPMLRELLQARGTVGSNPQAATSDGQPTRGNWLAYPLPWSDFCLVLKSLPNHKAPGPDGCPYEFLKSAPEALKRTYWQAVNALLVPHGSAHVPPAWKESLVSLLQKDKSKDPSSLNNMRPICLMSVIIKCFSKILAARMSRCCEHTGVFDDSAFGFRPLRSIHDAIASWTSKIADCRRKGLKVVALYIDLTNFYQQSRPTFSSA